MAWTPGYPDLRLATRNSAPLPERKRQDMDHTGEQTRLRAQIASLENQNLLLKQSLAELETSLAWVLVSRARSARRKLFREGTFRGRCWSAFARFGRSTLTQGPVSACRKAGRRILGRPPVQEPIASEIQNLGAHFQSDLDPGPLPIPVFTHWSPVDVSIIIPVYNHLEQTRACLDSIARSTSPEIRYEVVVIDDASSDDTQAVLENGPGLVYLRNPQNLGFIGSCNRGASAARGAYLVFLNNDTVVTQGWLAALHETFQQIPEAGLVGAKLVYPDGRLQEAGGVIWGDASGANYGHSDDPEHPRYNFLREADYCSGACIMVPKPLFEELGGFDAHYSPAYYEDVDLAFKVRHAGHKVLYQPRARIIHHEGVSSGTNLDSGVKSFQRINQPKFRDRWQHRLKGHPTPPTSRFRIVDAHGLASPRPDHILVIDHRELTPDRDCGSLRMWELLVAFRARGHHVTFVPENLIANPPYLDNLQALGVEVIRKPYYDHINTYLREQGTDFGLIVLSRAFVTARHLWAVRQYAPQARVVFDTVDLQFLREERQARIQRLTDLPADLLDRKAEELRLVEQTDLTLVVSTEEQKRLQAECPGCTIKVLPTIYPVDHSPRPGYQQRRDFLFIGGFEHAPNADAVLYFAREIFPEIQAQLPEVVFHVVGPDPTPEILALAGPQIQVHGHVPQVEPLFDRCRLSVAPLRYGAGVKGKVNQSMALGVPVVGSPIAAEGMHLTHGHDILIASTPHEFATAVVRLWSSPDLWQQLVTHGRQNLQDHYSVQAASPRVDELLAWAGIRTQQPVNPATKGPHRFVRPSARHLELQQRFTNPDQTPQLR